jgi:predicted ATPase
MTSDEVGRFIQLKSRANVPSEIVDATHSPTEGNPLFVTEVVRLVKQARFGEDTN